MIAKNNICISRLHFKILFFLVIVAIIGISLFIYINKNSLQSKATNKGKECLYPNYKECRYSYGTNCKQNSCKMCKDGSYKCDILCLNYGSKLVATSKGECWSIKSKKESWNEGGKEKSVCINEPYDLECEANRTYCNVNYYNYLGQKTKLQEYYIKDTHKQNICWGFGIETFMLSNFDSPECLIGKIDSKQCEIDTFTCKSSYALINNSCYKLRSRKCATEIEGKLIPACCSDKVSMNYCPI